MAEERKTEAAMVREALAAPKEKQRVEVVGRMRDGRIEIDQSGLDAFARKYPDARMTFIAVNAPFDPERSSVSIES